MFGRGFIINRNDPDYEVWAKRSEFPYFMSDGTYIETPNDAIAYDERERQKERQKKIESMNPIKRFFWLKFIDIGGNDGRRYLAYG